MKKTAIFFSLFFCLALASQAQDDEILISKQVVGFKAGLNFANIGGDATGISSRTAFHVGFFSQFALSDDANLQTELVYSSQGAKTDNGDNPIRYNYINVPIILELFVSEGLHFDFGPQIGFLVGAEVQANNITVDVKDQLNTLDLAAAVGLGYDFGGADFGIRYNIGLTNTAKDSGNESFSNQVFQLSLGVNLQKQ